MYNENSRTLCIMRKDLTSCNDLPRKCHYVYRSDNETTELYTKRGEKICLLGKLIYKEVILK